MAGHADTVSELSENAFGEGTPEQSEDTLDEVDAEPTTAHRRPQRQSKRAVIAVALTASAVLAGLVGWFGYGAYQEHQWQMERDQLVAVGRQAAVNLTTIDFNHADADVARILNSATGTFLDDFQKRAQPFIDVVKQAKSKSEGIVTDSGLENVDEDRAQILVAVQVKSSTEGGPIGEPRGWRMRIDVQKVGTDFKVANVQFVP